jgi:hypothetical protein
MAESVEPTGYDDTLGKYQADYALMLESEEPLQDKQNFC